MGDLDDNSYQSRKIKIIFKKKNLGEWESFIKQKEVSDSVNSLQIEGKYLNSPGSSIEDEEISQQLHLMHVTTDVNLITTNKNEKQELDNEQLCSYMMDSNHLGDKTSQQCNANLDLITNMPEHFDSLLSVKKNSDLFGNTKYSEKTTSVEAPKMNDLECDFDVGTSHEDDSLPAHLIRAGLSECPTLYLLPEFSNPTNLPRPPVCPSSASFSPHPSFPIIQVAGYEHAHNKTLQDFCSKQDCCLIRGLCRATNLKLELFSTSTLRETFGDYNMEIRIQRKFRNFKKNVRSWNFQSKPSSITIKQFAKYQALSFLKATSGGDLKSTSRKEMIHFGTNVDLSNFVTWKEQLRELEKLPDFLKVYCPEKNMLNHIGHNVLGVNTVQLYMKVPGCRTPGHQENNNFSAINLNIGPGSCEWFCVAESYWGVVYDLCKKSGINYSSGSWWPDLKDLFNSNVPVYRVLQEPGDVIWIGPGTIHWVQSIGWCNNVAWNVGPMSDKQFKSAIERYEYNRIDPPYKSIIPMVQLSWNLAQHLLKQDNACPNININYAEGIFRVISASLRYCKEVLIGIQKLGKRSVSQDRLPSDLAHYCEICMNEVFNIIFAHKNLVHCFACAIKKSACLKDFYVLEEYSLEGLQNVVDEFALKIVTFS